MTLYLKGPIAEVIACNKVLRSKFGFDFQPENPAPRSHSTPLYFLIRLLSQNSIFIHPDLASESPLKGPSSCQAIQSTDTTGPLHCKQVTHTPE